MVAEYETEVAPVSTAQVSYLTQDHLGSPRITTDKDGKVFSRRDFMPLGEEITSEHTVQRNTNLNYGEDGIRQKFTSYERDEELEEDFAEARYYNYNLGRFNSVDPILITENRLLDPQRINLFIYVRNNPLKFNDPTGEDVNLVNPTEEGRQNALAKIRANLTSQEAENIDVRFNDQTKQYEVYVRDSEAIDVGNASIGYQALVDRVNNHDLILNFNFLRNGESTNVEVDGVSTNVTQAGLSQDMGGFVAIQSDGSYAVVVAEGGAANGVQGIERLGGGLGRV